MAPLVSVIIPVYNAENYLNECVDSVLTQTHSNLEVFLIDDGSTDASPAICDAYQAADKRVQAIHKPNVGAGGTRNVGLERMKGDYVAFLDADDRWDSTCVEFLYGALSRNGADMSICNFREIDGNGKILKRRSSGGGETAYSGVEAMKIMLYLTDFGYGPWATLYKAELWKEVRFPDYRMAQDIAALYLVYRKARKAIFADEIRMSYRIHFNSTVHKPFNRNKLSVLDASNDILEYCRASCPEAVPAAESRLLSSACFIYFQIPTRQLVGYPDVAERCKKIIRTYRWRVMLDKESRRKTRIGAALSYLGFPLERLLYRLFVSTVAPSPRK